MLRVAHILTPVDPTSSNRALTYALFWAERLGATVHAVRVHQAGGDSLPTAPLDIRPSEAVQHMAREHADQLSFLPSGPPPVQARCLHAPTEVHGLLHYAARHTIDLIVVAPDRNALDPSDLPSPQLSMLVQQAGQPLLLVRDRSPNTSGEEAITTRRLLAPVDFSQRAQCGLDCAAQVAALYDAPLDILHVLERPPYVALNAVDMLALSDATLPERRAQRRIRALLDRSPSPHAETHIHVAHGEPARTIASFAHTHHSDLVVLPSHGTAGSSRPVLGTVAQKLTRRLDTSLLLLKPFGASVESDSDRRAPTP